MVSFIGAGPGDPELLTIKGKKLIDSADIKMCIRDRRKAAFGMFQGKTGLSGAEPSEGLRIYGYKGTGGRHDLPYRINRGRIKGGTQWLH